DALLNFDRRTRMREMGLVCSRDRVWALHAFQIQRCFFASFHTAIARHRFSLPPVVYYERAVPGAASCSVVLHSSDSLEYGPRLGIVWLPNKRSAESAPDASAAEPWRISAGTTGCDLSGSNRRPGHDPDGTVVAGIEGAPSRMAVLLVFFASVSHLLAAFQHSFSDQSQLDVARVSIPADRGISRVPISPLQECRSGKARSKICFDQRVLYFAGHVCRYDLSLNDHDTRHSGLQFYDRLEGVGKRGWTGGARL